MRRMAKQRMGLALALNKDNGAKELRQKNVVLACRAGVATVLAASLSLLLPLHEWFEQMQYNTQYIAVLILWNMGRNIGATIKALVDTTTGTAMAFLFVYLLEGFMPNGYHEGEPISKWMVGVVYTFTTSAIMVFLSWEPGVRVWCLSYHMYNMMAWLHPTPPGTQTPFSHQFRVDVRGAAFG